MGWTRRKNEATPKLVFKMRVDYFSTRFYIFENIYDNKILTDLLNTIKKDTHNLAVVASEPDGGPSYKTNYYIKDSHWSLFEPIVSELNLHLEKKMRL